MQGLYTNNASTPLAQHLGLRNFYDFGLYRYCAYVNGSHGTCSPHVTADKLQPYEAVTSDMPEQYTIITDALISELPPTTFSNSQYLGEFSRAAYYLLLLGSVASGLAFIV